MKEKVILNMLKTIFLEGEQNGILRKVNSFHVGNSSDQQETTVDEWTKKNGEYYLKEFKSILLN